MRRCTAIAFVLLTLYWAAAPLLACAVPAKAMTAQEHPCCEHTAQMCGSTNMPQSHSCCSMEAQPSGAMVVTADWQSIPAPHVLAAVSSCAEPQLAELRENEHHQPPGEFLPDTTVLRI